MSTSYRLSLQNPFQALKERSYLWFWISRLASESALRIGGVATNWLVYEITGSALALGWVSAGRALATVLISPWAGVLSDRVEKKRIILVCRWAMVLLSGAIALLAYLGIIQVWHLALSSLFSGIIDAFYNPASAAVMPELIDKKLLLNAYSLNSIGLGIASMVFPAVSGYFIEWWGVPLVLAIYAAVYAASALAMHHLPNVQVETPADSPGKALKDGLNYTLRDTILGTLIIIVIIRFFLAMQFNSLMTKFVSDQLNMGASTLGLILSVFGFGSLVASIVLACMHNLKQKGRLLLISVAAFGLVLIGIAFSRSMAVLYVLTFLLGAASNVQRIANQTMLQTRATDEYRGRVMSLYSTCQAFGPVSGLVFGAVADAGGVPLAFIIQGAALILTFFVIRYAVPIMWKTD